MFGQSLLSAFGIACTTDTDQLFNPTSTQINSTATYQLNSGGTSIPNNTYPLTTSNITYTSGKFGNAATYSGTNASSGSKMTVSNNIYGASTSIFSVSTWVKYGTTASETPIFGNGSTIGGTTGYVVYTYLGQLILSFANPAFDFFYTGLYLDDNQWHHIVFTFNNGPYALYVDGNLTSVVGTTTNFTGNQTPTYDTYFGNRFGRNENGVLNGQIDQIRVFGGTVLSQAAVTALYNETTTTAQNAYITEEVYNGIAYYKMSDATDQLGNYNGTATNVNFNTEGKFGFAGAFNGSSSYIDLGSNIDNPLRAAGEFGASFWFNANSYGSNSVIFKLLNDIYVYIFLNASNQIECRVSNSTGVQSTVTFGVSLNTWYHIVWTGNSTNGVTLYVNGSSVGNAAWDGTFYTYTNPTYKHNYLGYNGGNVGWFNGKIDQIRIYDSALSAADVSKLYKEIECEPVAINALDHFNTVLYTGDDTNTSYTRNVTSVGFKPDFIWIKSRDTSGFEHALFDSVRGAGASKILSSDTTGAEGWTSAGPMSAFITDGFSIQPRSPWNSNNLINKNGDDFVAWNWKAPLANLSTSFNGSSSKITLPNSIKPSNSIMSISLWASNNSTARKSIFYLEYNNAPSFLALENNLYTDSTALGVYYNNAIVITASNETLPTDGSWHHLVVTASATEVKLYKNGIQIGSTASITVNTNALTAANIGVRDYNNDLYWDGKIDQTRVFNTALSASEVSDLYAEPAASNNTLNYPAGAGCIAAYPLQTDAVDLSGNYNGASSNVTFGQPGYLTQNTEGTITSTVAANVDAGFSVVKYTGNGTSGSTIGHGLSDTPQMMISKRTDSGDNWNVYTEATGNTGILYLNLTDAFTTVSNRFNNTSPTSTVFTVGNSPAINVSGGEYIAYCFTSISGYSKVGSYTGTSGSVTVSDVGFQPTFLLIKGATAGASFGGSWLIVDSARGDGGFNTAKFLSPNTSDAEFTNAVYGVTFTSNGFTIPSGSSVNLNTNNGTFIYLAIKEN